MRDTANLMAATERTGADAVHPPMGRITGGSGRRLRIGYHFDGLRGHAPHPDVRRAVEDAVALLEGLGHQCEPTDWPFDGRAFMAAFGAVWVAGAARTNAAIAQVAAAQGGRLEDLLEPYTLTLGEIGASVTDAQVAEAARAIDALSAAYFGWFDRFDMIVSPVLLTPPQPVGAISGTLDFAEVSRRTEEVADFTMVQNATGGPAMSVPLAMSADGLPIGVHFAAPMGADAALLELAFELEAASPWVHRRPALWVGD